MGRESRTFAGARASRRTSLFWLVVATSMRPALACAAGTANPSPHATSAPQRMRWVVFNGASLKSGYERPDSSNRGAPAVHREHRDGVSALAPREAGSFELR